MTIFVGHGKSRRTEDYCIAVDKIIESTKKRWNISTTNIIFKIKVSTLKILVAQTFRREYAQYE